MKKSNKRRAADFKTLLQSLDKRGISLNTFMRVFELPTSKLAAWKNGKFTAADLTLLKIVVAFPWMIDVADSGFNKSQAKLAVLQQSHKIMTQKIIEVGGL